LESTAEDLLWGRNVLPDFLSVASSKREKRSLKDGLPSYSLRKTTEDAIEPRNLG